MTQERSRIIDIYSEPSGDVERLLREEHKRLDRQWEEFKHLAPSARSLSTRTPLRIAGAICAPYV